MTEGQILTILRLILAGEQKPDFVVILPNINETDRSKARLVGFLAMLVIHRAASYPPLDAGSLIVL